MRRSKNHLIAVAGLLACIACAVMGVLASLWPIAAIALIGTGVLVAYFLRYRRPSCERTEERTAAPGPIKPAAAKAVDPTDAGALAEQMLEQGRFALLLRAQIAASLSEDHFQRALGDLEHVMALVPDGEVVVSHAEELSADEVRPSAEAPTDQVVRVEQLFIDRFPVTNQQYYEFVAAGGYMEVTLWDPTILPAVLEMVDRTDHPGPRYWENGCYRAGQEDYPVVGISWYEAAAYARWIGKRLPGDAEWIKTGAWPVTLSPTTRMQRRYPWGDTMDRKRANLWGSGPEGVVPVDRFAEGVSVGGVYQLSGNVWEWTGSDYRPPKHLACEVVLSTPLKCIHGGAFDTYFDNQATCQFQSGENPLGRKRNIGFRCAVAVRDLTLAHAGGSRQTPADQPPPDASQVERVQASGGEGVPALASEVDTETPDSQTPDPQTARAEEMQV